MPLYRGTIYKRWVGAPYDGISWSNVYYSDDSDASFAITTMTAVATAEMTVSYTPVHVTAIHVINTADSSDVRQSSPGSSGALDPAGLGGPVPLFNTIRVVLTDDHGRPEQKYLRLGANVDNIENGVWSAEFVSYVQENYADIITGLGQLRGPSGDTITSGLALAAVQMRQLGWHRRERPGFHRGWVPNV